MEGKDVNILQNELTRLGFNITSEEMHVDNPERALFGGSTENAVREFQRKNTLEPTGIVDKITADLINIQLDNRAPKSFVVRGKIKEEDLRREPVSGIRVLAMDRDVRGWQLLGEHVTDYQGRYEIRYSSDQFSNGEKQRADLFFKLFDRTGKLLTNFIASDKSGNPLTTLNVIDDGGKPATVLIRYNAEVEQTVNFRIKPDSHGLSEYEQLTQELEPLLVNVRISGFDAATFVDKLSYLKKEDIDFLDGETGIRRQKIEFLISSAQLHKNAEEKHFRIDTESFYGLMRIKGFINFAGLARSRVAELRDGLIQAGGIQEPSEDRIIPPFESEEKVNEIAASIHQLATESIIFEPLAANKPTLTQVLASALPSVKLQVMLLQAFANHEGTVKEFWSKMSQHPDFKERGKVEKVQFTLQLALVTQNNLPLMNTIQNGFKSTRQLARLKEEELISFIKQAAAPNVPEDFPGDKEEKLDLYTQSVTGLLQGAFPTETVARIISKVEDARLNGSSSSSSLSLFLNLATDPNVVPAGQEFDICSTHIDTFIGKYGDKIIASLGDHVDKVRLILEIKRAQRLFQVSTSPETFQVLIESKLNSANDIATMPLPALKEEFKNKIDALTLNLIHQRAMAASAASLHTALQVYQSITDVYPMVVGAGLKKTHNSPNWAELFGSEEMCACEHCRSVYSPAAYLVDLLEFLRKSVKNDQGWTPLDVLIGNKDDPNPENQLPGKRPDLAHIPLTCENTNTPIPYIDLVNEILESYIVLGGHLDKETAKDTGDSTAEELASNPQYVEDAAYVKLRDAVFPLSSLPFDLSLEIARLYLGHLGTSRYDLMTGFGVDSTRLASEHLGLTEKDFEIFTGTNFIGEQSSIDLDDLFIFKDENLFPTLHYDTPFTPGQIMSGRAVVILQAKLNTDGANPNVPLDGQYNAVTQTAVKAFQQNHGLLPVDGVVDANDWAILSTIKPDAVGALISGVPEFLQRTNLSYADLIEILKTRFVNPNQQSLFKLQNAQITYKEVRDLIQSNFTNPDPKLQEKLTIANLTLQDVKQLIGKLLRTIVLYSENSNCELNSTLIQYLDGNSLDDSDLWRIQCFTRLWHKVGWTIPELDAVLISLLVGSTEDDHQIAADSLQKISQIKEISAELNNTPLINILSLWADIDTRGDSSLYKKLFLNKSILIIDEAFRPGKPDGTFLDDSSQMISAHIPTLLAAFQISARDLDVICSDLKLDTDKTPLTLANVSSIYRYVVLTKALKLKLKDLIALKTLTGTEHDPFQPKTPAATLAFVDLVKQVRSSGFSVSQLDYLYRHILETNSGIASSQREEVILLLKDLQNGLQKIAQDNAVGVVPDLTGDLTRNKLATIVDSVIADQTIQIVFGTSTTYMASLEKLPDEITTATTATFDDPSVKNRISYDRTNKKLHFAGLMKQAQHDLLVNASSDLNYQAAVNQLFQQSISFIEQSGIFIAKNLSDFLNPSDAKVQLLNSSISLEGKPDAAAIAQKFAYILGQLLPYLREKSSRSIIKQIVSDSLKIDSTVTQVLLEQVQVLKAYTSPSKPAIEDFIALVGDGLSAAYFNNATFTGTSPALNRVDPMIGFTWGKDSPHSSINQPTFSVRWTGKLLANFGEIYTFYLHSDGNLKLWIDNLPIADQGTIELNAGQLYDIKVEYARLDTNLDAFVELQWSSSPSTPKVIISQTQLYSGMKFSSFDLPLKAIYLLYKIALLVNTFKISAKELVYLSAHPDDFEAAAGTDSTDPSSKAPFNLNNLLPLEPSGFKPAFFDQWRRLASLFALRDSLPRAGINLIDVFEFASSNADKSELSRDIIKQLAVATTQNPDFINALSDWLSVPQATLKQILQNEDWTSLSESEIKILIIDPSQSLTHFVNLLARLTGLQVLVLILATATDWGIRELSKLIAPQILDLTVVDFKDERSLVIIRNCVQLIKRVGISAEKLFSWANQIPETGQAQDIKNTVKAKYDQESWLTVAKPLSDKLRESKRRALIAYVLTMSEIRKADVTDSNRLFEYFLIDVEMGACMATSRIKQALSSIQLFIQRCLLNLEPQVHPNAIIAELWQWMKNYRIWEANRKVFLYPENWIEPELRDDKSPFYKELESDLLQNDLTDKVVENALSSYLFKLDEVARLEICGTYLQEEDFESGEEENYPQNILHVFGRTTAGATRSYYYRRLVNNKEWSAWEKVELDIQGIQGSNENFLPSGVNLLPLVWRGRLYLFWLILTKKDTMDAIEPEIDPSKNYEFEQPQPHWEIALAWSKYDQGKWTPKQVSEETLIYDHLEPRMFNLRAHVSNIDLNLDVFPPRYDVSGVEVKSPAFHFDDINSKVTVVESLLANPTLVTIFANRVVPFGAEPQFMGFSSKEHLNLFIYQNLPNSTLPIVLPVLGKTPNYTLLTLSQYYQWPSSSPHFYQNGREVYFVRSKGLYEQQIVNQVNNPNEVFPSPNPAHNYAIDGHFLLNEIHLPAQDGTMNKTVINPWISAELQLAPHKIKMSTEQLGVKI